MDKILIIGKQIKLYINKCSKNDLEIASSNNQTKKGSNILNIEKEMIDQELESLSIEELIKLHDSLCEKIIGNSYDSISDILEEDVSFDIDYEKELKIRIANLYTSFLMDISSIIQKKVNEFENVK